MEETTINTSWAMHTRAAAVYMVGRFYACDFGPILIYAWGRLRCEEGKEEKGDCWKIGEGNDRSTRRVCTLALHFISYTDTNSLELKCTTA